MEKIHTKICINCTHVWVTQIDSNIRLCRVKGWEEAGFNNRSTCLTARVESRPSHSHPSSVAVTLLGNRCNQIKASSYWLWVDPDPMTAFLLKKKKNGTGQRQSQGGRHVATRCRTFSGSLPYGSHKPRAAKSVLRCLKVRHTSGFGDGAKSTRNTSLYFTPITSVQCMLRKPKGTTKTHLTRFYLPRGAVRKLKIRYVFVACAVSLSKRGALRALRRHQEAETGLKPRSSHPKGRGLITRLCDISTIDK